MSETNVNTIVYNIFGSETSLDRDIMVIVPSPLNIKSSQDLTHKLDDILRQEFIEDPKELNTNICAITNGDISWVFKGTPDECQNSILATYKFHEQKYPCIVERMVERNIPMKIARGIRSVLSTMTRTEGNRVAVKKALKDDTIRARIDCVKAVDITTLVYMGNCKEVPTELNKQIAFQMGQLLALISAESVELYDKVMIGNMYPSLTHSLRRLSSTQESQQNLQDFKTQLIERIEVILISHPEWETYGELLHLKNIV